MPLLRLRQQQTVFIDTGFQGIPGSLEQFTTFQVFCCLSFKLVQVRCYHQKQNKDTCTNLMLKVL